MENLQIQGIRNSEECPSSAVACYGGRATDDGRRIFNYAAVTRDEDNAIDGGFPTASLLKSN